MSYLRKTLFVLILAASFFVGDSAMAACDLANLRTDAVVLYSEGSCDEAGQEYRTSYVEGVCFDLSALPINGAISSALVAEGYMATLYDISNCSGDVLTLDAGIGNDMGTFNDKASALRIVQVVEGASVPTGGETSAPSGGEPAAIPLQNPLGNVTSIPQIIGRVINTILGILGAITLFVFVYGAFHWITAAGSAERVKKGVKTMLFAVAGLFIIFASYGILNKLFEVLGTTGG